MTEPSKMPARINVWGGPGSGWNDVTFLNEVRTTRYIRADISEAMAAAIRSTIYWLRTNDAQGINHLARLQAALSAWEESND